MAVDFVKTAKSYAPTLFGYGFAKHNKAKSQMKGGYFEKIKQTNRNILSGSSTR